MCLFCGPSAEYTVIGTVIFACRLDREEWVTDVMSLCRWRHVVVDAALVSLLAF